MQALEVYTLPDYYACYAMYGDQGDLTDEEISLYDEFIKENNLETCVDIGQVVTSTAYNDLRTGLFCDCFDYTFTVKT